jgi:hypothetical protein
MAILGVTSSAFAVTNFTPTDLSSFSSGTVTTLVQTVGIAADHHAYMPATALGLLLGLDVGVDATYLPFPTDFTNAIALATGQSASAIGSGAVLPKVNVHKGLPFGIDVGGSFMSIPQGNQTVFSSYAGEIKWAFVNRAVLPSVAARFSAAYNNLYFLTTHTYTFDVLASKNLFLIDPYVGAGLQFWSGDIAVPSGIPSLPSGISTHASGMNPHVYGGLMLKLAILHLVAEADYSTAGLTTFGGKASIGF